MIKKFLRGIDIKMKNYKLIYSLGMWSIIIIQIILVMWSPTTFSKIGLGFNIGLWLGSYINWEMRL